MPLLIAFSRTNCEMTDIGMALVATDTLSLGLPDWVLGREQNREQILSRITYIRDLNLIKFDEVEKIIVE